MRRCLMIILFAALLCGCPPRKVRKTEQPRDLPEGTSLAEQTLLEELDSLHRGDYRRDKILQMLTDIEMAKQAKTAMTVELERND